MYGDLTSFDGSRFKPSFFMEQTIMETNNIEVKFIKITSVKQSFYNKYGDPKNLHKYFKAKKYGNIKDSKHTRPYFLFEVTNNLRKEL
jgi:hypothetical protein